MGYPSSSRRSRRRRKACASPGRRPSSRSSSLSPERGQLASATPRSTSRSICRRPTHRDSGRGRQARQRHRLGERECSIQRSIKRSSRNALAGGRRPSAAETHQGGRDAATTSATTAWHFEFLLDEQERFYFMRLTQVQVEHPSPRWSTTSSRPGADSDRAARSCPSRRPQDGGHSIECRINAETR